jgi:HEAT repeat protein
LVKEAVAMLRYLYAVTLALTLVPAGVAAGFQDPPKPDPKNATPQKAGPATDEEADAALAKFKKDITADLPSSQMAALKEVGKCKHEKIIRAIASHLRAAHPDVAATASLQLGEQDNPLSADLLVAAIMPNEKRQVVLGAIFTTLGKLGYESASPILVKLLDKANDDDWKKVVEEAVNAVGRIGSASAVDPILDWRKRQAGGGGFGGGRWGRGGGGGGGQGNQGGARIWQATDRALKSITGGDEETTADWEKWWKANRADLMAAATVTYRCNVTWERFDGAVGKKAPCPRIPDKGHGSCTQKVRVRLIPESDAPPTPQGPGPGGQGS